MHKWQHKFNHFFLFLFSGEPKFFLYDVSPERLEFIPLFAILFRKKKMPVSNTTQSQFNRTFSHHPLFNIPRHSFVQIKRKKKKCERWKKKAAASEWVSGFPISSTSKGGRVVEDTVIYVHFINKIDRGKIA
jgi:hypothetical protein